MDVGTETEGRVQDDIWVRKLKTTRIELTGRGSPGQEHKEFSFGHGTLKIPEENMSV